jgi:hypothetical protein
MPKKHVDPDFEQQCLIQRRAVGDMPKKHVDPMH